MLEYTKSLGSVSWALSLVSADQALALLKDPNPDAGDPSVRKLESISHAMEGQLGAYLRGLYSAGDRLQRSTVDLAFAIATLQAANPGRAIDLSADWVRRSIDALEALIPGGEPTDVAGQPCGWGAMPAET
jgi:hypothetical protein